MGRPGHSSSPNGEVRVDRGVSHDLVVPERIEADVVLVSGYVPPRREALAAASAEWIALDAARLGELPPGANVVFASGEQDVHALAEGRRLAVVTLGAEGAIAVAGDRVERARPARSPRTPGSGDVSPRRCSWSSPAATSSRTRWNTRHRRL